MTDTATQQVGLFTAAVALGIREARVRRKWTLRELSRRARVSVATAHAAESGERVSLDVYVALTHALGLRLDAHVVDPREKRRSVASHDVDPVHAAMGELEAAHLRPLGYPTALDEPHQHYQFAGRADVLAWSLEGLALLHIENRTRFPNMGETAGAYIAKRSYLPAVIAERLGIDRFRSVTHVMACLWSSEILHVVRMRPETFRSLYPDGLERVDAWWSGHPPVSGTSSTLVLLDPFADGRQRRYIDLDAAINGARPRVKGYAEAVARLVAMHGEATFKK